MKHPVLFEEHYRAQSFDNHKLSNKAGRDSDSIHIIRAVLADGIWCITVRNGSNRILRIRKQLAVCQFQKLTLKKPRD
jgi:hypothetical protein